MPDLLFEIGAEEIPAGYIEGALEALKEGFGAALKEQRLPVERIHVTGTPRRLVLHARGVPERQEDVEVEVSGPPKRVAFDGDGNPTKAGEGFARKQGIDLSEIQFRTTDKGEYCFAVKHVEGMATVDLLVEVLPGLISRLPFPKSMRWLEPTKTFARPIRTLVAILGETLVPFEFNGVRSATETRGHPFLAPGPVPLRSASWEDYAAILRENKVLVDLAERRSLIEEQLERIYETYGSAHRQPGLAEEVTNLVEWPHTIEGRFEEEFLVVPAEVIEAAMMEHQRYFPVRDAEGRLLNRFAFVSNRDQAHEDGVRRGNERVLRARLADARFFWDEDRKTRLADRVEELKSVLYQIKLGSYQDRTARLRGMARFLAAKLGLPKEKAEKLDRAARLCKTDLLTQMVHEFPSLQGVMGRHYALQDGEDPEVAGAIEEHYLPKQAGGALPETELGVLLALAEKADTVAACFSAGLAPTASQDPYGLRRQTVGIIRILLEKGISVSLSDLFGEGLRHLPETLARGPETLREILAFVRDRLNQFCLDRDYRYDLVNAALEPGFDDLLDFRTRLDAVRQLSGMPEWLALVEVVERTFNITRNSSPSGEIREELLHEAPEAAVFEAYRDHRPEIEGLFESGDYVRGALLYHAVFAGVVHEFFGKVFVNVDDEALRANRLLLMRSVYALFAENLADLVQVVMSG